MPNHCENDLYISGPVGDANALLILVGAVKEPPEFDCGAVIPYPEEFASKDKESRELGYAKFREKYGQEAKDGFNSGGYEWCIKNWGTKWGAYDVSRRNEDGKVILTFLSAWSPPSPVICALHKRFPTCSLRLEFFECGAAFCGGFKCLSKEDYGQGEDWEPGRMEEEWEGNYRGERGG